MIVTLLTKATSDLCRRPKLDSCKEGVNHKTHRLFGLYPGGKRGGETTAMEQSRPSLPRDTKQTVTPLGDNLLIAEHLASGGAGSANIDMNESGEFMIVWDDAVPPDYDVYGQRFTAEGVPMGPSFHVNFDSDDGEDRSPDIDDAVWIMNYIFLVGEAPCGDGDD